MRTVWYLILFGSLIIHHCFTTVSGEGTPAGEAQPSYTQCKPYVDAALKGDIPAEPTVAPPPSESQVEKPPDAGHGSDDDDNNTSEGTTEEDDDESKEFRKNPPVASKAESSKAAQEDENNTSEGTTEEDDDESKEYKKKPAAAPAATDAGVEDENNTSEGTTEEDDDESKEFRKKPAEAAATPAAKDAGAEDENNTSEGTTEEDSDESKEHKKNPPVKVEAKKDDDDDDDSHEGGEVDDDSKEDDSAQEQVEAKPAAAAAVSVSKSESKSDDDSKDDDSTSEESAEPEKAKAEASKDDDSDSDEDGSPEPVAKDKVKKGAVPSPVADDTDESDSSESEEKEVQKTKKSKKSETSNAPVKSTKTKAAPPPPPPEESSEESDESDSKEDKKGDGDDNDEDSSEESDEDSFTPRSREHITKILGLDDSDSTMETFSLLQKATQTTLKDLKSTYEAAIKPLEFMYKYRDLSNRHFGDPEIFSKPLVVFMGPWSGGKSTIINWLLGIQHEENALRTGADPSPAQFNIMMWGEEDEVLDGTQLAADWTFSGLQKFGQNFLDRLRGRKLPTRLLEKVNLVEIPGILEIRKQVERSFPFNDACQWFIDRADLLFLVYDPAKLDIGPETEAILDQLKGRENQVRIILNKADTVKPEELLRVQATLVWNISPLMSSSEPPILYAASLWEHPFLPDSPVSLLTSHENLFLKDIRDATEKRVETRIAAARRFAVRVRNHAKMCDCYLNTYNNHRSFFSNKKKISDDIVDHPQNYHIYEGLSTLTNISRYDLPDPDTYRDFFRLNPLWEFPTLASTCTYFRGCPINKLDIAIAYDLPELLGRFRRQRESILAASNQPRVNVPGTPPKAGSKWKIEVIEPPAPPPSASATAKNRWKKDVDEDPPAKAPTPTSAPSPPPTSTGQKNKWKKDVEEEVASSPPAQPSPAPTAQKNRWKKDVEEEIPAPAPEAAAPPPSAAPKNRWKKDVEEAPAPAPPAQAAPKNKWKKDVEEAAPPPEPTEPPPAAPKNRWKKE